LVPVLIFWIKLLVTVPIILDQAVGECSGDFGSVDWLLFPFFGSSYKLLFHLFWIRPLVTLLIILDQAVSYCCYYFGSWSWLLLPLFWIRPLVTLPIIVDQAISYCYYYFGPGCWLLFLLFWICHIFYWWTWNLNAKSPYQPCIIGIKRSTTIKFKVMSREYLPIWTIHRSFPFSREIP
jgi:hypothetical protein